MNMIVAAAALPTNEARAIVALLCRSSHPHQRTLKTIRKGFKAHLNRVLNFAKHETLRKLHRYVHSNRPLTGADNPGKTAFDPAELGQDLQSMMYATMPDMLSESADSLGYDYTMPKQDVLDFIANRADLLSDLPDELFKRVADEISTGLAAGENISQLSDRVSQAFDDIDSGQADVIADTESAAAFNYATNNAAKANGVRFKQWVHGGSRVPRDDHLAIDGLVVPFDEPYPVGNPPLMFPHAPDGSPEDVINCSCVSIPADASDYEGS